MSATPTALPNLVQIRPGGSWAKEWIIRDFFIYLYFFRELTYRSDLSTDFHAWWLKRRGLAQWCAFSGFRWYWSPYWGWTPPPKKRKHNYWAWIGVFQTCKILKVLYYRKYCINFNQILHSDKKHEVVVASGPKARSTKPRWRTATILEKLLNRHISATVWPILMKFSTAPTVLKFKFSKCKIDRWLYRWA